MFEGAGDYLAKRAQQLGLERADILRKVQAELDRIYPGQARAISLNGGVLQITTPNAALASELRFNKQFGTVMGVTEVRIRVGSI